MFDASAKPEEINEGGAYSPGADTQKDAAYGIVVTSIGTAGASMIAALKIASKVPEQVLAYRLFQAPSMLFKHMQRDLAEEAVQVLRNAGVECEVRHENEPFTAGDAEHEVALVVRDIQQMSAILESIMNFLGASAVQARQILCASPAVLLGRISAATVEALKKRFAPLDVSVDVSKPAEAKFDVFLGECNKETRAQVEIALNTLGIEMVARPKGDAGPLLVMGVSYADAERIHSMASRGKLPLVIVNRDFQRFDVRLDTAPATPELKAFLLETTKMPEHLVPKVLGRLPLVTHPSVGFSRMCELVAIIGALGGTASGHLLSFQSYSLAIDKVGDADASMMILRGIGGLSKEAAKQALWTAKEVQGPLSHTLARWTQLELKKVGTTSRMVQR